MPSKPTSIAKQRSTTIPTARHGKRKREESPESTRVTINLSSQSQPVGPILASFPAVHAPASTAFQCYTRKKSKNQSDNDEDPVVLVAGETDAVEFASDEAESRKVAGGGCRYLVAMHNRRSSTLTVFPQSLTPYVMTHTVKALKSITPSEAPTASEYREARTTLGETFGTKKAKAAIRAQERNRIDVSAMEGVVGFVMDGIEKGAEGLMTQEEAKAIADENRIIPPFSETATDPADVYPLHSIIPEVEWKTISTSAYDQASNDHERKALLPHPHSRWCNNHLHAAYKDDGKKKKKEIKILIYISAMLAFQRLAQFKKTLERTELQQKLSRVPDIILDSFLSRFTETPRNASSYQFTPLKQTLLLTHIFALRLKLDNYATDTEAIAQELKMPVAEVNRLFRSLGCKMQVVTEKERLRLGLPPSASGTKRAFLTAPVVFPKAHMGRRK